MTDETMTHAEADVEVPNPAPIESDEDNSDETDLSGADGEEELESLTGSADGGDPDGAGEGDEDPGGEGDRDPDEDNGPELTSVEVTINGEKRSYDVPKELGETFNNMNRDYSVKTQALADERKGLESQQQQVIQYSELLRTESEAYADIKLIGQQLNDTHQKLSEMSQTDWEKLEIDDPVAANSGRWELQNLRNAAMELQNQLHNRKAHLDQTLAGKSAAAEQDFANRAQETKAFAEKEISGWSDQRDRELLDFAANVIGMSQGAIKANLNPKFVQFLDFAEKGYRLQNSANTAKPGGSRQTKSRGKPGAQQTQTQPNVTPTEKVSAKAGKTRVTKDPSKMSPAEYRKWRTGK
ncbi:MAG: hypothetical protein JJ902_04030 [Roseibium sp.]|nr:hypothetical protein [Roseibium sp.]